MALIGVFPIYWMISSAFLPTDRRRTPEPTFLPLSGTLSDFRRVLTEPSFFDASRVSLAVTESTVVGAILLAFPATLTISRFVIPGPRGTEALGVLLDGAAAVSRAPTRPASGRARAGRPGHRPADYYRHTHALKPEGRRP